MTCLMTNVISFRLSYYCFNVVQNIIKKTANSVWQAGHLTTPSCCGSFINETIHCLKHS